MAKTVMNKMKGRESEIALGKKVPAKTAIEGERTWTPFAFTQRQEFTVHLAVLWIVPELVQVCVI